MVDPDRWRPTNYVSTVLLSGSVFLLFFCLVLCFYYSSLWSCVSTVPMSGPLTYFSTVPLYAPVLLLFFCLVLCFYSSSIWSCVSTLLLSGAMFLMFLCLILCILSLVLCF